MTKAILDLILSIFRLVCLGAAVAFVFLFANTSAMRDFQWAVILLICSIGGK